MPPVDDLAQHDRFGGFEPVRKIGQGATSVVFEGRRLGGDFTQRVAIKVVLTATRDSLPLSETGILARLEHPSIARLLDAGSTRAGLRYLVMEYVDGVPCTEYVNARNLDEAARLRLFLEICEAVQHANRSLVIHCDLKPANVLVSQDGVVKLLDFGISRLLSEASGTDRNTRNLFYSPSYASPEQILGRPLTVATDVYSLGALLCELIGGRPPIPVVDSSPEQLAHSLHEKALELPLSGDVEQIVRKALQPEPSTRYATVADLAADVKRYLAGRPILARPLSRAYRLRKFVGRHRLAVAAVSAACIALLFTTAFALRQRSLAMERFGQVRSLANAVLFEIHDEIAKLPGSLSSRHLIVNRGLEYLDSLAKVAGSDDAIQLEAARGFLRLADIEGVGNEPSLSDSDRALPRVERAGQMIRAVLDRNPRSVDALRAHYNELEALGTIYSLRADPRAVATAEEHLRVGEQILAARPGEGQAKEEHAFALARVANNYTQSKTHGEQGVPAWERATAAWKQLYDEKPDSVLRKRELARCYQFLGGAYSRAVKREEARAAILVAYRMHKELALLHDEDVEHMIASDVGLLANLNAQLKRYPEALPLFQEQLRIREGLAAADPNNNNARMGVAATLDRIGYLLVRMDKPAEGMPYLENALKQQRTMLSKDPENVLVNREMLYVLNDLTEANEALKRPARMCQFAAEAMRVMKGPIARTRETPTDAAKKAYVRKISAGCGVPN